MAEFEVSRLECRTCGTHLASIRWKDGRREMTLYDRDKIREIVDLDDFVAQSRTVCVLMCECREMLLAYVPQLLAIFGDPPELEDLVTIPMQARSHMVN